MDYYGSSNKEVLGEVGRRIRQERLNQNLTQQELADHAGIGRVCLSLIESTGRGSLMSLVRILRALRKLDALEAFLPEPGLSPMQLVKLQGKMRQRGSGKRLQEKS